MIDLTIINPKHILYQGEASSVFLPGDHGEFVILPLHAPIVSLLKPGEVVVNWEERINITRGMVKFDENKCVIVVEE